jgi:hypothetical protein
LSASIGRSGRRPSDPAAIPAHFLAFCLVLGACAAGQPGSEPKLAVPSLQDFVLRGLLPLGDDRVEIVGTLGTPDSLTSVVVHNRHVPGVQDTLYTIFYPRLVIGIHHPGGGSDLISAIDVADNRFLRYPTVGIGVPESRLREALGPPTSEEATVLTYQCGTCQGAEGWVDIFIRDGRVERIRFNNYVD